MPSTWAKGCMLMIVCLLSDLTWLPVLCGGRKSLYIIITSILIFLYDFRMFNLWSLIARRWPRREQKCQEGLHEAEAPHAVGAALRPSGHWHESSHTGRLVKNYSPLDSIVPMKTALQQDVQQKILIYFCNNFRVYLIMNIVSIHEILFCWMKLLLYDSLSNFEQFRNVCILFCWLVLSW